ncbi:MAG: hypothetical protein LBB86_05975 [Oscillospiraceae bacterium]|jgi:hypothetical protein|nr:hypothetical protein [Oscillospiraceae bacterium]
MQGKSIKNIVKLNQIDSIWMLCVYVIHALLLVAYTYVMWQDNYYLGEGQAFYLYSSFTNGGAVMLCFALSSHALAQRSTMRTRHLLVIAAAVQGMSFAADVVYVIMYGGLWEDGYFFFAWELLLMAVYLRRYFTLCQYERVVMDDISVKQGCMDGGDVKL